ncbi:sterol 26-hydroxylase, mitochondrial isoform X2 [Parambassis ranga]|uniref:Sterol 26-hydroxylase, mitochondrial isoform X2 n=1 Tax=Parambassis ranga TaxID=210632 RepID=A0A6P7HIZ1_9TELE|nr:sterol 26-hydroxylase, mitochondrial-like isoform X2 [Parambassis ranga]
MFCPVTLSLSLSLSHTHTHTPFTMSSAAAAARSLRLRALCAPPARLVPLCSARRKLNVQASTAAGRLKTIDDLPGPSALTTVYWLLLRGYLPKTHLLQGVHRSQYGPIWRSRVGPYDLVNVASPDLIAQVIQQEGRYPVRCELPHWKEYRDLRGQAYGLHVDTGENWYRMRSVLNPKMLKSSEVSSYAPIIHQVVDDLLQRLELLRSRSVDGATVPDLPSELYKFGFEGISSILFETRLGCLKDEIPHSTLRFITAVNDMLSLSQTVPLLPRWSRAILPLWRRFVQAWDDIYDVAQGLVSRRIAEIEARAQRGEPTEGLYLTHMLSSDKLSRDEVYITIAELLLGGVDTTSNTLSWALYHLARDGRVQDRLYAEVKAACPDRRPPTSEDLSRMPYLKAVIKETLRLYPVVPGNGRFVSENEVILDNYWFPKKTLFHLCHYAASHDQAEFEHAERFIPERWDRSQAPSSRRDRPTPGFYQHHPYSFIPFGVGVRACVGKRVAEMEMYFALSRLMQHYQVQPEDGAPIVRPKFRTLLIPEKPINLRFLPRA